MAPEHNLLNVLRLELLPGIEKVAYSDQQAPMTLLLILDQRRDINV